MEANPHRVVYVLDDDDAVRDSTQFMLEAHGVVAKAFDSPRALLAAFDPERAGCLLLDLHMPEMSGLDVLKLLRSRGIATPVIVISGRSDANLDALLIDSGAMATLRKPPDNAELIGLIRRAMAQSADG